MLADMARGFGNDLDDDDELLPRSSSSSWPAIILAVRLSFSIVFSCSAIASNANSLSLLLMYFICILFNDPMNFFFHLCSSLTVIGINMIYVSFSMLSAVNVLPGKTDSSSNEFWDEISNKCFIRVARDTVGRTFV